MIRLADEGVNLTRLVPLPPHKLVQDSRGLKDSVERGGTKMLVIYSLIIVLLLSACTKGSSQAEKPDNMSFEDTRVASGDGCLNDEFPTLLAICENEKIEIRHESRGCFHYYEDVFEISGNAPLDVVVRRLHPDGDTFALDKVEEKGAVTLTEAGIGKANRFIAHYLDIGSQEAPPTPSIISTTEDTIRLMWYRDGEIVEEIRVQDYGGSFPFLSEILSRAK